MSWMKTSATYRPGQTLHTKDLIRNFTIRKVRTVPVCVAVIYKQIFLAANTFWNNVINWSPANTLSSVFFFHDTGLTHYYLGLG